MADWSVFVRVRRAKGPSQHNSTDLVNEDRAISTEVTVGGVC